MSNPLFTQFAKEAISFMRERIGCQTCIDLSIPNTEENRQMVQEFDKFQAKEFGDEVQPLRFSANNKTIETNDFLRPWVLERLLTAPQEGK